MRHVIVVFAVLLALSTPARAAAPTEPTLYVVAASHLDTQWWWTIQETIRDLVPATFRDTYALFDKFPDFTFSWEGAFRYRLLAEYFPELFAELKTYAAAGRWRPGGSAVDAGDVNVPSPESLMRQFLYGNGYFRELFGQGSVDVFLPDCFGFGWALPTVAAHCGLKGFSTQKLTWGSSVGIPFPVGFWKGPDGRGVVAALDPGSYAADFSNDLSEDAGWLAAANDEAALSDIPVAYKYFGVGDRGGAVHESSVQQLEASIAGTGPLKVRSTSSDQLYRDLSDADVAKLPVYDGELLLYAHGTGSYTSQGAMKRWNRANERLANATERASVAAAWLGGAPYPRANLTDAWWRFLWHQFHDDLTGTGIPEIYTFSWNDELLTQNRFAAELTEAVGAVARALDTDVEGVPLVVYNALAFTRTDAVEAVARFPGAAPEAVRVVGPDGAETPAQVVERGQGWACIVFVATVPSVGFAVYDARAADAAAPSALLGASETTLENENVRAEIDVNGDLARVTDKSTGHEWFSAPAHVALFDDMSFAWPAWEIPWANLSKPPREVLAGPTQVRVVENGPARVAVEVTRTIAGSTFVQTYRLVAGGERLEILTDLDWRTKRTFAKAVFPLATPNPEATYDLGMGVIRRGNDRDTLNEVPAQQWADLTATDGSRGVAVLSDSKYGWDKPDDGTLRLTLVHTPIAPMFHHDTNDLGRHRFAYALYGHPGDWRQGVVGQAAAFDQPLWAFQASKHAGSRGASWSLASLEGEGAAVMALKRAEDSDEVIVRVREASRNGSAYLRLHVGDGITAAREVDGAEQPRGEATLLGGDLVASLSTFEPRTFALKLKPNASLSLTPPSSRPVTLPFDTDVASGNDAREDGTFDASGIALAAELLPAEVVHRGLRYVLGSTEEGALNAVTCRGQEIALQPQPGDRLYVLASADTDVTATFRVGTAAVDVPVQAFTGFVGQWDSRVMPDGKIEVDPAKYTPAFVKPAEVAWYGAHRHAAGQDEPYVFTYLFRHVLPIPAGATTLTLPDDSRVKVLAVTLAADPNDDTVAASVLHDGFDPLAHPIVPALGEMPQVTEGPEPLDADTSEGIPGTEVAEGDVTNGGGGGCNVGLSPRANGGILLVGFALALVAVRRRRCRSTN